MGECFLFREIVAALRRQFGEPSEVSWSNDNQARRRLLAGLSLSWTHVAARAARTPSVSAVGSVVGLRSLTMRLTFTAKAVSTP